MKLRPCPFCGMDNARIELSQEIYRAAVYYVRCAYCGAQGPPMDSRNASIDSWNDRPKEKLK